MGILNGKEGKNAAMWTINQPIFLVVPTFKNATSVYPATLILRQTFHAPASCGGHQTFAVLSTFQYSGAGKRSLAVNILT